MHLSGNAPLTATTTHNEAPVSKEKLKKASHAHWGVEVTSPELNNGLRKKSSTEEKRGHYFDESRDGSSDKYYTADEGSDEYYTADEETDKDKPVEAREHKKRRRNRKNRRKTKQSTEVVPVKTAQTTKAVAEVVPANPAQTTKAVAEVAPVNPAQTTKAVAEVVPVNTEQTTRDSSDDEAWETVGKKQPKDNGARREPSGATDVRPLMCVAEKDSLTVLKNIPKQYFLNEVPVKLDVHCSVIKKHGDGDTHKAFIKLLNKPFGQLRDDEFKFIATCSYSLVKKKTYAIYILDRAISSYQETGSIKYLNALMNVYPKSLYNIFKDSKPGTTNKVFEDTLNKVFEGILEIFDKENEGIFEGIKKCGSKYEMTYENRAYFFRVLKNICFLKNKQDFFKKVICERITFYEMDILFKDAAKELLEIPEKSRSSTFAEKAFSVVLAGCQEWIYSFFEMNLYTNSDVFRQIEYLQYWFDKVNKKLSKETRVLLSSMILALRKHVSRECVILCGYDIGIEKLDALRQDIMAFDHPCEKTKKEWYAVVTRNFANAVIAMVDEEFNDYNSNKDYTKELKMADDFFKEYENHLASVEKTEDAVQYRYEQTLSLSILKRLKCQNSNYPVREAQSEYQGVVKELEDIKTSGSQKIIEKSTLEIAKWYSLLSTKEDSAKAKETLGFEFKIPNYKYKKAVFLTMHLEDMDAAIKELESLSEMQKNPDVHGKVDDLKIYNQLGVCYQGIVRRDKDDSCLEIAYEYACKAIRCRDGVGRFGGTLQKVCTSMQDFGWDYHEYKRQLPDKLGKAARNWKELGQILHYMRKDKLSLTVAVQRARRPAEGEGKNVLGTFGNRREFSRR